jgi:hypothetical protein
MKLPNWSAILIPVGFTAILVAYFLIWLPQPIVGLSFIGLEMGEWVKFLPQVRSGEIIANRNFFYIPPITLGMMILAWTVTWPNKRWQTWVVRGLAVAVAFLAFPSVEAIFDEPASEWLLRLILVMLVMLLAVLSPFFKRLPPGILINGPWIMILLLGLTGAIFPTWAYLAIRRPVGDLLRLTIGIGPGVWLNAAGHILLAGTAAYFLIAGADRYPNGLEVSNERKKDDA